MIVEQMAVSAEVNHNDILLTTLSDLTSKILKQPMSVRKLTNSSVVRISAFIAIFSIWATIAERHDIAINNMKMFTKVSTTTFINVPTSLRNLFNCNSSFICLVKEHLNIIYYITLYLFCQGAISRLKQF